MDQKTSVFHYSKNYSSLTCVTILKVAVNITDRPDSTCLFRDTLYPLGAGHYLFILAAL